MHHVLFIIFLSLCTGILLFGAFCISIESRKNDHATKSLQLLALFASLSAIVLGTFTEYYDMHVYKSDIPFLTWVSIAVMLAVSYTLNVISHRDFREHAAPKFVLKWFTPKSTTIALS